MGSSERRGDMMHLGHVLGLQHENTCCYPRTFVTGTLVLGWTDRQTEMFNCRLFQFWLKALRAES